MRNKHSNRILGRTSKNRAHLLRSLSCALVKHGSIITTTAKAKELRLFFEPLITLARQGKSLVVRRRLLRVLTDNGLVEKTLFIAKKHERRPGGYLRLTNVTPSLGDNAQRSRVDILD